MQVTGINVYRAIIGDGILLSLTHDVTVDGQQVARHEYVRLVEDTALSLGEALLDAVTHREPVGLLAELEDDVVVQPTVAGTALAQTFGMQADSGE
jgi:hypothetical protein